MMFPGKTGTQRKRREMECPTETQIRFLQSNEGKDKRSFLIHVSTVAHRSYLD